MKTSSTISEPFCRDGRGMRMTGATVRTSRAGELGPVVDPPANHGRDLR